MIKGSCLCGAVRFEVDALAAPFELCHCNRCRKVSGSAFMAGVGVLRTNFRWTSDVDSIRRYDAPLIERPPNYRVCFCSTCGSPVPDPASDAHWFEIPAGLLDDAPALVPDKHIFVDYKAPWYRITDELPQLDKQALIRQRLGAQADDEP